MAAPESSLDKNTAKFLSREQAEAFLFRQVAQRSNSLLGLGAPGSFLGFVIWLFSSSPGVLRIMLTSEFPTARSLVALFRTNLSNAHRVRGSQRRTDLRLLHLRRQINYSSICSSSARASRGASHVRASWGRGRTCFSSFPPCRGGQGGKGGLQGCPSCLCTGGRLVWSRSSS